MGLPTIFGYRRWSAISASVRVQGRSIPVGDKGAAGQMRWAAANAALQARKLLIDGCQRHAAVHDPVGYPAGGHLARLTRADGRTFVNRTLTLASLIAVLLAGCAAGATGSGSAPPLPDPYYQGASNCTDCRK